MGNNKFMSLKVSLLGELQNIESLSHITEDFRRRFMELIELCAFSLMNEDENFFALFLIQMKREIKFDMPSPTGISASVSYFTIYFNPFIFLNCSLEEMKALIKHDIYHIMYGHLKRASILKRKYSNLAVNLAMDIAVNQYIKNLPSFAETIQGVRMSYNADLKLDGTMEEHAKSIQEAIDRLKGDNGKKIANINKFNETLDMEFEYNAEHTHDIWDMSQDFFNFEQLDELTKKAAFNSNRGKIPAGMESLFKALYEKPEISWSQYLKKVIGTIPSGYKKTITRKDRRQPDRLDIRGKLSDHVVNIAVAVDISGSMTDMEIRQAMVEIFSIIKNSSSEVIIIECDNEVRRTYKVKSQNDIKKKLNTKGGTKFSPVFRYMRQHGMRNYLLIYFTDGAGEEELEIIPSHYKTLWVLTGKGEKLSLNKSYGEIKRLSNNNVEKRELDYGAKNALRELLIVEWAK